MTRLWWFCLFLIGCSATPKPFRQQIDDDFAVVYNQFQQDATRFDKVVNYDKLKSMTWTHSEETFLGRCFEDGTILINRTYVDSDPCLLTFTIYHELGHCLLLLPHRNDRLDIMNPEIDTACSLYQLFWDDLVANLFLSEAT